MTKITSISEVITKILSLLLLLHMVVTVAAPTEFNGYLLIGGGDESYLFPNILILVLGLIVLILCNFFLSFRTKNWQPAKVNLFAFVALLVSFITYAWY